jgi:hypothetical protein
VISPLETFAGLLDRSVREIARLSADARTFDGARIGGIADIWDNNTFPLVSAASTVRPWRNRRARAGLRWMAGLGAARRALMVDLDPALDGMLPAAALEGAVYRDYLANVRPGTFPVTAEIVAGLATDYDLAAASVRSLTVRPAATGPEVRLTLAAPRRFTPSMQRLASNASRRPWPAAPLHFTFVDVTGIRFDAGDRVGMTATLTDAGPAVAIGHSGGLRARCASVWPDDPLWHESAAGRAADAVTPHARPKPRRPVRTSWLTVQQRAAARALVDLMVQVRLVSYYPDQAARIPLRGICRVAADAGGAILAAGAHHGRARRRAFAELIQRWNQVPPDAAPAPIPSGPATIRHVRYAEPHDDYDVHRDGSAVLVAAVPDTDPAAPWRLAGERVARPARFHLADPAFDDVQHIRRDGDALTVGDIITVEPQ